MEIQNYNYLKQFSFYFNSEQAHGMHSYEVIGYLIKKASGKVPCGWSIFHPSGFIDHMPRHLTR